jgi:hypothetical protein
LTPELCFCITEDRQKISIVAASAPISIATVAKLIAGSSAFITDSSNTIIEDAIF